MKPQPRWADLPSEEEKEEEEEDKEEEEPEGVFQVPGGSLWGPSRLQRQAAIERALKKNQKKRIRCGAESRRLKDARYYSLRLRLSKCVIRFNVSLCRRVLTAWIVSLLLPLNVRGVGVPRDVALLRKAFAAWMFHGVV
jgi:hypothetical protein